MGSRRTRSEAERRRGRREEGRREEERWEEDRGATASRNAAPQVTPAARIQTLAGDPSFMTSLARTSIFVRTKHEIKPRRPCFTTIGGSHCGFANIAVPGLPLAANESAFRAILAT